MFNNPALLNTSDLLGDNSLHDFSNGSMHFARVLSCVSFKSCPAATGIKTLFVFKYDNVTKNNNNNLHICYTLYASSLVVVVVVVVDLFISGLLFRCGPHERPFRKKSDLLQNLV